ncbi:hypothetical protein HPT29_020510 [Microvirga terrae]|uniref:Uncharacterized protein n=1 Tax=Microvirga terrae TaxID=2740529 RepID=A0ABY5RP88_9HYPH|nr:hypothetical protein [Microvirga terrae]UVF18838.1 hypothetical protein HPT29_020510 [Microvirga terrae]
MPEITPDQMDHILGILNPQHAADIAFYPLIIKLISLDYQLSRQIQPFRVPIKEHRKQIERVFRAAFELRAAINSLWKRDSFIIDIDKLIASNFEEIEGNSDKFLASLSLIIALTRGALDHEDLLSERRGEEASNQGKKSVERWALWEPLFQIWVDVKGNLKFAEDGPLHRFVDAVQVASGGGKTNPDSLKKAVRSWNPTPGTKGP